MKLEDLSDDSFLAPTGMLFLEDGSMMEAFRILLENIGAYLHRDAWFGFNPDRNSFYPISSLRHLPMKMVHRTIPILHKRKTKTS